MKEDCKPMERMKSQEESGSLKGLQARATLKRALDSMARLRATIDRRPSRLTRDPKTSGR